MTKDLPHNWLTSVVGLPCLVGRGTYSCLGAQADMCLSLPSGRLSSLCQLRSDVLGSTLHARQAKTAATGFHAHLECQRSSLSARTHHSQMHPALL